MEKISKMVYMAPLIEVVPYGDELMQGPHGPVSRYWTGHDDESPEKPGTDPPPGGWGDWTAKDFMYYEEDDFGWDE